MVATQFRRTAKILLILSCVSNINNIFQLSFRIPLYFPVDLFHIQTFDYYSSPAFEEKIKNTYPSTEIKADGQVIEIPFSDGMTFELLPAFLNTDKRSYTHPDANEGGHWNTTNPRAEQEAMALMNKTTNGNLVHLCRMIRAWRMKNNVMISGILIDTLAYNFISQWKFNDRSYFYYDWMSRDFFKYLSDLDCNCSYWFAPGSRKHIKNSYRFQYKAKQAYKTALDAIDCEEHEYEYTAKENWREIYGSEFPF